MKLIFKGDQGDFPDKSFCKLSRRRKCENEQSAITLPCLPVFFTHITYAQLWYKCGLTSCSNWAEVGYGTSTQFGRRRVAFLFPAWNNFTHILWTLQIGKQCKPVQVYKFASSGNRIRFPLFTITLRAIFANLACWVNTPNPLWTPPAVSAAHSFWILLLTDFCTICIEVQFPINEKWKCRTSCP